MKQNDYLQNNYTIWQQGSAFAENVESCVFRVYSRVFKSQFGIDGSKSEKLLVFGCGPSSALQFFKSQVIFLN